MKNALLLGIASFALIACSGESSVDTANVEKAVQTAAADETVKEAVEVAIEAGSIEAVLAGAWRSDRNKARDAFRNPAETLAFFGVEPGQTVVEISPGRGAWYTEVLAPYIAAGGGTYIGATNGDPEFNTAFLEKFGDEAIFGQVQVGVLGGEGIEPGTVDTVLTFRNIHNWMRGNTEADVFANAYAALKPGGVFGVIEHRLPSGAEQDPQGGSGYVHQDYAIALGEAAGFQLAGTSEINANPKDTADHPFGVWTLPPASFAGNDDNPAPEGFDAAAYKAIGESDRFTLKFVKPASATTGAVTDAVQKAASDVEEKAKSAADVVEGSGAGS